MSVTPVAETALVDVTIGGSGGIRLCSEDSHWLFATVNRILSCAVHVFSFQDVFVV